MGKQFQFQIATKNIQRVGGRDSKAFHIESPHLVLNLQIRRSSWQRGGICQRFCGKIFARL
jgi:hypothetical protein